MLPRRPAGAEALIGRHLQAQRRGGCTLMDWSTTTVQLDSYRLPVGQRKLCIFPFSPEITFCSRPTATTDELPLTAECSASTTAPRATRAYRMPVVWVGGAECGSGGLEEEGPPADMAAVAAEGGCAAFWKEVERSAGGSTGRAR